MGEHRMTDVNIGYCKTFSTREKLRGGIRGGILGLGDEGFPADNWHGLSPQSNGLR